MKNANRTVANRAVCVVLAFVLGFMMSVPIMSFAKTTGIDYASVSKSSISSNNELMGNVSESPDAPELSDSSTIPPAISPDDPEVVIPGDSGTSEPKPSKCSATIEYYDLLYYEDENHELIPDGVKLLGEYKITDLNEGDVLDAWDYVVNIPGHMFFDGWPAKLVVGSNDEDNVITLNYIKLWNYEYTVNYYLMEGADLTADNWNDALAPDEVRFIKMGSQVFMNQPFDKLVLGSAYEYKIDGTYVIDSYPSEIHVGTDADNNVINVLYTPVQTTLPDDNEVPDGTEPPSKPVPPQDTNPPIEIPSNPILPLPPTGEPVLPPVDDDEITLPPVDDDGEIVLPPIGDDVIVIPPADVLPPDTDFDEDEIIGVIPPGSGSGEIIEDFVGSNTDVNASDKVVITDEMLAHPLDKEEATKQADALRAMLGQGSLASTGDQMGVWICILGIIGGIAAIVIIVVVIRYLAQKHHKNQ